jgi:Raf kinase inhibitor-like YbhB/YbcL family protein
MSRLPATVLLAALSATVPAGGIVQGAQPMAFTLSSSAFAAGGDIPTRYTCEGEDISPPLTWSAPPPGTRSLALILDDPDAPDPRHPQMTWTHWVLYNLPPIAGSLPEAVAPSALPTGTRPGLNDWKRPDYGGPCPPIGRHRYFHKLYALDIVLADRARQSKAEVEAAFAGHVLAQAELIGGYQKKGR